MSLSKLIACGAFLLPFALLTSCGEKKDSGAGTKSSGYPRSETLYLAGSQWGDPNTFNPLVEPWMVAWPANDRFNIMYEPLTAYNSLTGAIEPVLGTLVSYDGDKVVVDIQPEAKWSDGTPVTSVDVKFIYELGKRFPQATTSYIGEFVSGIEVEKVDGVERISFLVNKKERNNPLAILDQLQAVRIVPAHIFEKFLADNNNNFDEVKKIKCDKDPVVSGPYTLSQYNNERIVLVRRDDYWGKQSITRRQASCAEIHNSSHLQKQRSLCDKLAKRKSGCFHELHSAHKRKEKKTELTHGTMLLRILCRAQCTSFT